MDEERWLPIVGYEGLYEVSDHGRVRSLGGTGLHGKPKSTRLRKLTPKDSGHLQVDLWRDNSRRMRKVHQLVLEAFIGPRPGHGYDGCHWDGDPANNHVSNLRWDTKLGNAADTRRHGTHNNTKRTHCLRGHPMRLPNLTACSVRKGQRTCLACTRARTCVSRNGGDFQEVSDRYYAAIEMEATDA